MRTLIIAVTLVATPLVVNLSAQRRGPGGPTPAPPTTGWAASPYDITGYWVSLIMDDWRYRMLTPPKGNVDYLPITTEGRRVTNTWDPARDAAAGEQCRAYGAGGIMRLPLRLHITWEDDDTLRMDIDAGSQTRRLFFESTPRLTTRHPPPANPSWQGYSVARWEVPQAAGWRGEAAPASSRFGQLKVVTTHLRPGYVRKNGVPYGANATITEDLVRLVDGNGQEYLAVTTTVDDATYFRPAYIKTYEFKKQKDASGWNPRPCVEK